MSELLRRNADQFFPFAPPRGGHVVARLLYRPRIPFSIHYVPKTDNQDALLEKLWSRMNERGEFPMLSNSLRSTISAMKTEDGDFTALVQLVLSDFTLTQKVIRLANSAMYMAFGRNTTTVSRALMILGMDVVGHLIIGLKIVDHFRDALTRTEQIDARLELNRVMLASQIARKVSDNVDIRGSEQAVVCTLMRQCGRLLCMFYLEQEWETIHTLIERKQYGDDEAAIEVLGITFEELGLLAAERWGLPPLVQAGMQTFDPVRQEETTPEIHQLRAVTNLSTEVSTLLVRGPDDAEIAAQALELVTEKYSAVLQIDPEVLRALPAELAQDSGSTAYMQEIDKLRTQSAQVKNRDAERHLRECIDELRSLPPESRGAKVFTMALEAMLSSLSFSRAIAFVRDPKAGGFVAPLGLGADIAPRLPQLHFDEQFSPDVFHLAIANSVGIFIENSYASNFTAHIPAWFREAMPDAQGFVLLPVRSGTRAVALLYGDWNDKSLVRKILPREMSALNELARELGRFF
jgi:HD-like signal output (HDOD) protein